MSSPVPPSRFDDNARSSSVLPFVVALGGIRVCPTRGQAGSDGTGELADELHPQSLLVPLRVGGKAGAGAGEDPSRRPQQCRRRRAGGPAARRRARSPRTRSMPGILLIRSALRSSRPTSNFLVQRSGMSPLIWKKLSSGWTSNRRCAGGRAPSRPPPHGSGEATRAAHGIEVIRRDRTAPSFRVARDGALWTVEPRRPRSARARRSHVLPPTSVLVDIADRRIQRDHREGWPLVEHLRERGEDAWELRGEGGAVELGAGHEPAGRAGCDPGDDRVGQILVRDEQAWRRSAPCRCSWTASRARANSLGCAETSSASS